MNVVKQVVTKTNHYCGDCGHGAWHFDHENLDVATGANTEYELYVVHNFKNEKSFANRENLDVANRLPICCRCPFTPNRSRIRSETACLNWIPKKPGELIVTPDKIVRP